MSLSPASLRGRLRPSLSPETARRTLTSWHSSRPGSTFWRRNVSAPRGPAPALLPSTGAAGGGQRGQPVGRPQELPGWAHPPAEPGPPPGESPRGGMRKAMTGLGPESRWAEPCPSRPSAPCSLSLKAAFSLAQPSPNRKGLSDGVQVCGIPGWDSGSPAGAWFLLTRVDVNTTQGPRPQDTASIMEEVCGMSDDRKARRRPFLALVIGLPPSSRQLTISHLLWTGHFFCLHAPGKRPRASCSSPALRLSPPHNPKAIWQV